uniref:Uncharacterized protein n=1 Tax=viral metagenome TaxID=1070528 RepID=A0A6C0JZS5_9ZZZZ
MRLWYLVKTFSIFYVSEKWKKYLYAPIKELHLAREVGVLNEKRCKSLYSLTEGWEPWLCWNN